MTHTPQRSSPEHRVVCPTCGGSGTLRLGDQSFRTCLDCLGQGSLPALAAAETTAVLVTPAAVTAPAAVLAGGRPARATELRNAGISAAR
jgi:DnaJ-class molecular chaperone